MGAGGYRRRRGRGRRLGAPRDRHDGRGERAQRPRRRAPPRAGGSEGDRLARVARGALRRGLDGARARARGRALAQPDRPPRGQDGVGDRARGRRGGARAPEHRGLRAGLRDLPAPSGRAVRGGAGGGGRVPAPLPRARRASRDGRVRAGVHPHDEPARGDGRRRRARRRGGGGDRGHGVHAVPPGRRSTTRRCARSSSPRRCAARAERSATIWAHASCTTTTLAWSSPRGTSSRARSTPR